ncbi:MAG: CRISPR-associated helicase/endonuclease Cas3 [Acidobacteria bacterium]|nr:MAG: CRISPR-associated helicase/endonuclease Cas3 [Acidobacteriota bacterium]
MKNQKTYIAHARKTKTKAWEIQTVEEHLESTAKLCKEFVQKFDHGEWGYLSGKWHDLGKYLCRFQKHIRAASGYDEDLFDPGKSDHSSSGAILAFQKLQEVGYLSSHASLISYGIAGHHTGLLNWSKEPGFTGNMESRLKKTELLEEIKNFLSCDCPDIPTTQLCYGKLKPKYLHIWIRMVFSCLLDADRLDTERFMTPEKFQLRGGYPAIKELKAKFSEYMKKMTVSAEPSEINQIRNKIQSKCISHGKSQTGIFSITVPTGGGKTLASMAWALEHAILNNKDRIIIAIPFTSIITQTAQEYRKIFGEENIIEHHSDIKEDEEDYRSIKRRLVAENWDAPIIITTNVQLFESLFSARTSRCRKLHNIVNSVIILDEAQMLPAMFLKPVLTMLKGLKDCFNVSVLLSTATQPAFVGEIGHGKNAFWGFLKDEVVEIAGDVAELATKLKRVRIKISKDKTESWESVAAKIQKYDQILCIVNTRKDCYELSNLLPKRTIHLSRTMCSQHLEETLDSIKEALRQGRPVRVVSTQLIEAGVDLDFPVVFRAFAGLDSIVQAAGRCNREGKLGKLGRVYVFFPPKAVSVDFLRKGCDAMTELLSLSPKDFTNPELFTRYFELLYAKVLDFDKAHVYSRLERDAQELKFQFAEVSRDFKLIEDDSVPVFVTYGDGIDLIELLRTKGPDKSLLRKLQRYSVALRKDDVKKACKMGLIEDVWGLWVQATDSFYDKNTGVHIDDEWVCEIC